MAAFEQLKSAGSWFFSWWGAVEVLKFDRWYQKNCWAGSVICCSSDCCLLTSEITAAEEASPGQWSWNAAPVQLLCSQKGWNRHSSRVGNKLPTTTSDRTTPRREIRPKFGPLQTATIDFLNESLRRRWSSVHGTFVSLIKLHFIKRVCIWPDEWF